MPNTRKYRHDPYAPFYRIGDIIIIRDSVHAPIDALSSGSAYAPIDAAFSGVSQTILQAATALPDTSECKARPGIVVDKDWRNRPLGREPWPEKVMVCLLTSYGGIHTSKFLPAILKEFFAVPVSRHCETITSDFHLHTYPEWQKENAWLIAYPFTSTGEVLGRWEWRNSRGRSEEDGSFKVAAPRDLEAICDARLNKWTEWQLLYGDEFQDRCEETYDVSPILNAGAPAHPHMNTFDQLFVDQEAWAQRICQMLVRISAHSSETAWLTRLQPDRIDEISGDVVSRRSAESTDNETDDDASRVSDGDIGTTRMEQAESVVRAFRSLSASCV